MLASGDDLVRLYAARLLGIRDNSGVEPFLVDALSSPNERVRSAAAIGDPNGGVRACATQSLGNLGDPRAVAGLIRALEDPKEPVRAAAASSLGSLGGSRAVTPLMDALRDPGEATRMASAEALGKLDDARALYGLVDAPVDVSGELRSSAVEALGSLNDPRAVSGLIGVRTPGYARAPPRLSATLATPGRCPDWSPLSETKRPWCEAPPSGRS